MRRLNPTAIALLGGVLVLLILLAVFASGRNANRDRLSDDQVAGGTAAGDPEKRCGSQATYDLIKRDLFRRAAQLRGSDRAAFDRLAAYSVVRMDAPMLKSHDEEVGTISCSGTLALDLPPGVAVVGGRRTLTADIGYAIQPAADGSGDVVTLTNADGIVTPLATLARIGAPVGQPLTPAAPTDPTAAPPIPVDPSPVPAPSAAPPPSTAGSPSFNCQYARTRSEIAICDDSDSGLAGLDRQMAAQFNGAMAQGDAQQRALLQSTRNRFLAFRDACRSDSCIADAYRGRMAEIRDIMAGRWRSR